MNIKKKVFVDVFYYKAASAGIRTYISELNKGLRKYGNENIDYIFSHDIDKTINNSLGNFIRPWQWSE